MVQKISQELIMLVFEHFGMNATEEEVEEFLNHSYSKYNDEQSSQRMDKIPQELIHTMFERFGVSTTKEELEYFLKNKNKKTNFLVRFFIFYKGLKG